MNTNADMSIFKNGRFGISSKYDVVVKSIGFDKDRKLVDCWSVPKEMVLKIIDCYGNAANYISICEVPEHKEEDNE